MKRLTRLYINDYGFTKPCDDLEHLQLVADKLGQLEDYEDELGIDLIALKTAQKGFYSKYFDSYVKPIRIVIFEEATRPYIEVHHNKMIKLIFIDEYGKTWALTKEELEDEE